MNRIADFPLFEIVAKYRLQGAACRKSTSRVFGLDGGQDLVPNCSEFCDATVLDRTDPGLCRVGSPCRPDPAPFAPRTSAGSSRHRAWRAHPEAAPSPTSQDRPSVPVRMPTRRMRSSLPARTESVQISCAPYPRANYSDKRVENGWMPTRRPPLSRPDKSFQRIHRYRWAFNSNGKCVETVIFGIIVTVGASFHAGMLCPNVVPCRFWNAVKYAGVPNRFPYAGGESARAPQARNKERRRPHRRE